MVRNILLLFIIIIMPFQQYAVLYAESGNVAESSPTLFRPPEPHSLNLPSNKLDFLEWVNTPPNSYKVNIGADADYQAIREQWEDAIGIDIFYLYFKVQDIKIGMENKTRIRLFQIEGKAKLDKDEAGYIFSLKF